MKRSHRTIGFTLVELLLVCLVIATLAAIVAPSFTGSTKRAKLDGTVRTVVALGKGARARASADGIAYFLVIDPDLKEIRVARQRDPLASPLVEGDAEVDSDDWTDGAPWARTVPFEEGVTLAGATLGGMDVMPQKASGPAVQAIAAAPGTPLNPIVTTDGLPLNSPKGVQTTTIRVCFAPEGTADDATFDFEGADGDRTRVVIESASARTRVLSGEELEASLAGTQQPLPTERK
jgi:type II secretory pathway pseudopilin PulG